MESGMDFYSIIQSLCTVVASFISAYALVKVNKIDNQDKIRRSLWSFEQYLLSVGKCVENPCKQNLEEYNSYYTLHKIYVGKEFRERLDAIDKLLRNREMKKVKNEIDQLTIKYYKLYNMSRFLPRRFWNIF